jgi:hypothetical protein
MKKPILVPILGFVMVAVVSAAQAPTRHATAVLQPKNSIHLLKFDVSGADCIERHCELTLSDQNGLTAFPAVRVPGDRLYVRVFDDTFADLTRPRSVPRGHYCVTYSTARVELSNSVTDGSVVFGAQVRNVLFDFAKLSGSAGRVRTVVLVFETESGPEAANPTSVLRLNAADVATYFRYAIEVKFTLPTTTFQSLLSEMPQPGNAQSAPEEAGKQPTKAGIMSLLAAVVNLFTPVVHAAAPPPPSPVPGEGTGTLSTEQIQVLLYPECDTVGPYVPAHADYTLSSVTPAADLVPTPCGE